MAKSFPGMIAGGHGGAGMQAHCNAIASESDNLAKEYDGMSTAYRKLAKRAQA